MVVAWWIAAALLIVVIALFFAYRKTKQEVKRQQVQIANLMSRLSSTRYELKEVNARRKKLLTASTQALIIVEKDFTISSANKVAKRLFGKPHKEATLMSWIRQHKLQELVSQTMQGNKLPTMYFAAGERILEANARYIKHKKKITAVALAVHDITELQKLSRSQRDFITNISHELRTPLASIQLLTDTLINGGLEEPVMAANLIDKMAIQVDTLNQLAQEVLDLSLIESGKVPLRMSNHPLHSIVEAQLERYLPQAERKKVCLEMDVDQHLSVLVDDKMIGRVISNLIHNAIKFTDHGKIMVSAHKLNGDLPPQISDPDEEWVQISVSDTGMGLSNEEIERIFERFYKVNQARNRSKGESSGTGLGLAIAKHIIEAHGGAIWAEQNEQEGATFHFTLHTED